MNTMLKFLAILPMALLLGTTASSQDRADAPPAAGEQEQQEQQEQQPGAEDEGSADDGEPVFDDSVLDDQTYEGDDDVFIPSEEVPVDEPIPFPSDI